MRVTKDEVKVVRPLTRVLEHEMRLEMSLVGTSPANTGWVVVERNATPLL